MVLRKVEVSVVGLSETIETATVVMFVFVDAVIEVSILMLRFYN